MLGVQEGGVGSDRNGIADLAAACMRTHLHTFHMFEGREAEVAENNVEFFQHLSFIYDLEPVDLPLAFSKAFEVDISQACAASANVKKVITWLTRVVVADDQLPAEVSELAGLFRIHVFALHNDGIIPMDVVSDDSA